MNIPTDPYVLFSWVNTQLRDNYPTIEALCADFGIERATIDETLAQAGFEYNASLNKFI